MKRKMRIEIDVPTKLGDPSMQLVRTGTHVSCYLGLRFLNEKTAKEFTREIGANPNKLLCALEERQRGYFMDVVLTSVVKRLWIRDED